MSFRAYFAKLLIFQTISTVLVYSMFFAGMARPTVPIQNQPPHNRARGIVIYNGST